MKSKTVELFNNENTALDLSVNDLFEVYRKQSGRCHYSGICLRINGPFQISLERIDTFKGYSRDNVLICGIFNTPVFSVNSNDTSRGSSQWSSDKIKIVMEMSSKRIDNVHPLTITCFDAFTDIVPPIDKSLTQFNIDAILDDFRINKKWCADKKKRTEHGVKMKDFIHRLRVGGTDVGCGTEIQMVLAISGRLQFNQLGFIDTHDPRFT